jgi:hypothetical protein
MITRRQVLEQYVKPNVTVVLTVTKEPWNCVVVECDIEHPDGGIEVVTGIGFSKCNTEEDVYSEATGFAKAEGRAIQNCLDKAYVLVKGIFYKQKHEDYVTKRLLFTRAIANGTKLRISYLDLNGRLTTRVVEPTEMKEGYGGPRQLDTGPYVVAWCELREEWRHFNIARCEWVQEID